MRASVNVCWYQTHTPVFARPSRIRLTESDVLAQEASMFVLQREGTNAERESSAAVGAFLLGMAPSGAAMQGVDAGGVAAGDARASGSAGVNVSYVT